MAKILILNGSPRAPKSNSKRYAEIFLKYCGCPAEYCGITKSNHEELCRRFRDFTDILLVFPLYADGIPVTLLNFLKTLEQSPPENRPTISVLINCGFLEARQNDVAVKMAELFCRRNGYPFGSVLKIGSGGAILDTPFQIFAARKIRRLAASVVSGKHCTLQTSMPLSPSMFVKASVSYWVNYGAKNGSAKEQMETMEIEK